MLSVIFKEFVFYSVNPCWGDISFAETGKTISSSKNPKSSNLFQVFLRIVFNHN